MTALTAKTIFDVESFGAGRRHLYPKSPRTLICRLVTHPVRVSRGDEVFDLTITQHAEILSLNIANG
nr:hypothetical protein [uncultured Thiocystis sp.]